ncbi:hypothetical protein BTN50_0461 [Candidatus Enterovibrio altilux]|uniref:Uncharacterized protein n=1 Tax=Candidatus Enterovibrio altilux TaxID=1927128 RepID=A0A291B7M3_9GAMM|nr:hypothetical protein BTN50_0461 [Candidatus Enterovibrio luxaltus]
MKLNWIIVGDLVYLAFSHYDGSDGYMSIPDTIKQSVNIH